MNVLGSMIVPYIQLLPQHLRRWALLASRIVCGVGSGNRGVLFASIAMCSKESERNKTIAFRTAISYASYLLGPVLQAAMVPIGFPGIDWPPFLMFNMFTAPSYAAVGFSIFGIALVAWGYSDAYVSVKELNGMEADDALLTTKTEEIAIEVADNRLSDDNYDKSALIVLGCLGFAMNFCFSFDESISAPFSMTVLNWTKSQAIVYAAIFEASGVVLGLIVQPLIGLYAVRFRSLLLLGFLLYVGFVLSVTPWPVFPSVDRTSKSNNLSLANAADDSIGSHRFVVKNNVWINSNDPFDKFNQSHLFYSRTQIDECSPSVEPAVIDALAEDHIPCCHKWCVAVPSLPLSLYVLSYVFILSGNSIVVTSSTILFASVLGENRQERWMGYYTCCEFVGLALAPILGTFVFEMLGPRNMWWVCGAVIIFGLGLIVVFYGRLIPLSERKLRLADI